MQMEDIARFISESEYKTSPHTAHLFPFFGLKAPQETHSVDSTNAESALIMAFDRLTPILEAYSVNLSIISGGARTLIGVSGLSCIV